MKKLPKSVDVKKLLSGSLSPQSITSYVSAWRAYLSYAGSLKKAMDPVTLVNYKHDLMEEGKTKPDTIRFAIAAVCRVAKQLHHQGHLSNATIKGFYAISRPVQPKREQQSSKLDDTTDDKPVYELCDIPEPNLSNPSITRDRAILLLLASSGISLCELISITTDQVIRTPNGNYALLDVVCGNKRKPRSVPIDKASYDAIQDWLYMRPMQSDYVFNHCILKKRGRVAWSNKSLAVFDIHRIISVYAKIAGHEGVSPRHFRRVALQKAARKGLEYVRRFSGRRTLYQTDFH